MRILHLAAFMLAAQLAFTQITITAADMPDIGDTYTLSTADTLLLLDPAPTGAGFNWDFSTLEHVAQTDVTFVPPNTTNFLYLLLWAVSDAAATVGLAFDFGDFSIENAVQFFSESSTTYAVEGFGGEVSGAPIPVIFDSPDVLYTFPMDFGNVDSSSSGFTAGLPGVASITEVSTRVNEVDGWGTLTTPYGTFDVLRLKSTVMATDSVDAGGAVFGIDRITTEYKWLGTGTGMPLLQIDVQDVLGLPVVSSILYQDSLREEPVGFGPPILTDDIKVYPNPATNHLTVEMNFSKGGNYSLQLLSSDGQLIQRLDQITTGSGAFIQPYNLPQLSNGLYILQIRSADDPRTEPVQHPLIISN